MNFISLFQPQALVLPLELERELKCVLAEMTGVTAQTTRSSGTTIQLQIAQCVNVSGMVDVAVMVTILTLKKTVNDPVLHLWR